MEIEPESCAVEPKLFRAIERFGKKLPDMDGITESLWYDGPLTYSYDQIQQNGSDELQEIVFIITGGVAPGNRDKERDAS